MSSISNGDEERIIKPNILSHDIFGDDRKGIKRNLRTLDLENVKAKSTFEKYNLVNPQPFYLEDPFTTYAKGESLV